MSASAPREVSGGSHRKFALPRRFRLLNSSGFQRVFAKPYRSSDRCFTVLARENGLNFARLGLAISRKAAPKASQRNRLKRLTRESFRHFRPDLPGIDVVVMARKHATEQPNKEILNSLSNHWQRLVQQCAKP